MKQYLTLKSTPELTPQLISEVLGKRFPTYAISINNDNVRIKKNALVTVAIKIKHETGQTIISVGTLMPWWVWAIIGWLLYLIVKRGFVDEVFSTLLHDFRLMYPNIIPECYSAQNVIDWKNKTKSLVTISTILLIWIICFCYFISPFWSFINNMIFGDDFDRLFTRIYSLTYLVPPILWLLIGINIARLGKQNIKYAGFLIMSYAVYSLCNEILSILFICDINLINMPRGYAHIHKITDFVLLFSAGCLIFRKTNNGALRFFSFAVFIYSISAFSAYIVNHVVFDFENLTHDIIGLITTITSCCVSPFHYVAYILIFRAFHKLPKYPM